MIMAFLLALMFVCGGIGVRFWQQTVALYEQAEELARHVTRCCEAEGLLCYRALLDRQKRDLSVY